MVNARTPGRAFFIERAWFFDTCGAEKIKCAGSAKGWMPEESGEFVLIVFLNPGEESTEKFVGWVDFYQVFSLTENAETFSC